MENCSGQPVDNAGWRLASIENRTRLLETRADETAGRLLAIELLLKMVPAPVPIPIPAEPEPPVPTPETPPRQDPVPVPVPDPEPVLVPPAKPEPKPEPVPVPAPLPPDRPEPTPVPVPPAKPEPKPVPVPAPPSIDFGKLMNFVGKYGLAVIGCVLLAITAVWGMTFVYQSIGPEVKLAAGGLFAASLIVFGERKSRDKQLAWWAQAIIGAGYAVAYFVGYAAHNVGSLQLITNPVVDSAVLMALAFAGGFHAIWRKSEPIALLSVLLAFVTISLSHVTYFSVFASGLMLAGLVLAIARMRWYGVYVVGSVASYATFMMFTQAQVMASSATALAGLGLSAAFLFTYWFAFNAVAFLLKPSGWSQRYAVLAMVIGNAVAFLVPTMYQLGNQFPELRWAFLTVIGTLYLASAALAALRKDHVLGRVMLVLALQLLTAAVPLKLDGNAVTAVWLLEVVALTALGIRFNMPTLRLFGVVVGAACGVHLGFLDLFNLSTFELFGFALPSRTLIGVVAIISAALCYVLYARGKFDRFKWESELDAGWGFYRAAMILSWLLPFLDAPAGVLALVWGGQYIILVAGSRLFAGHRLSETALWFFISAGVASVLYSDVMTLPAVAITCAMPFAIGLIYRFNLVPDESKRSPGFRQIYFVGASALMFTHTILQMHNSASAVLPLVSEAALLVAAGFVLRDAVLRQLGAVGFIVTLGTFVHVGVPSWQTNLIIVGLFSLVAVAYRLLSAGNYTELDHQWLPNERAFLRRAYCAGAAVLLACTFLNVGLLAAELAPLALSLEGVALVILGIYSRDTVLRLLGAASFVVAAMCLFANVHLWSWLPNLTTVTLMLVSGVLYRRRQLLADDDGERFMAILPEVERRVFVHAYTALASLLLGVTFLHLLDSAGASLALAVQGFVLVVLGHRFRDTVLRLLGAACFGGATLCLLAHPALWSWGVNAPVVLLVMLAGELYARLKPRSDDEIGVPVPYWFTEREFYIVSRVYPVVASALLSWTFIQLLRPGAAFVALALQVAALAGYGLHFSNTLRRLTAAATVCVLGLFMALHISDWSWVTNVPVVALLGAVAVAYRWLQALKSGRYLDEPVSRQEWRIMKQAYGLMPALLLAGTALHLLTAGTLPVVWALEGILLVILAFRYGEVYLKAAGLALFLALIGKFLVYDLSGATDGLRILSWFGAALLTLGAAWAFFKFDPGAKKSEPTESANDSAETK